MELVFYWRVFNGFLAGAALLYLMLDLRVTRYKLSTRRLYLTISLAGLLFTLVIASVEGIIQSNPPGFRTAFATFITTLGVIAVAVINNKKERAKAADAGVEAGLDEKDVLSKMLSLISENERKEKSIFDLKVEIGQLKEDNRSLRIENTMLRLSHNVVKYTGEEDER